jgi:hypothetical protein
MKSEQPTCACLDGSLACEHPSMVRVTAWQSMNMLTMMRVRLDSAAVVKATSIPAPPYSIIGSALPIHPLCRHTYCHLPPAAAPLR